MRGSRPSHTALKIAKGLVFMAQNPKIAALLPQGAVECTERLLTETRLLKRWESSMIRRPEFRRFAAWIERRTMPGATVKIAIRKRFLDDETRVAIREGATQVLSVGAGLDSLCVRLADRHPDLTFVEVDHPGTHEVKRRGLEAIGALRPNLHLLGVDLTTDSLDAALARSDTWRRDARSVVVAEGVLMYLDKSAVSTFLEAIHRITPPGSRLLFTHMRTDETGRIWVGKLGFLTRMSLKMVGEPLKWAVPEGRLAGFLQQHGYRLDTTAERYNFRSRYLDPAGLTDQPLGDVEFMALAETIE